MRLLGKMNIVRITLALFFLLAAILPMLGMFAGLLTPDARAVFGTEQFVSACFNSVAVSFVAMLISLSLALAATA